MNKRDHNDNAEVLEAIQGLAEHMDERFVDVEKRMDTRFADVERRMVTKDYLDEKMADLRGDLVVLMRKEDRKVEHVIQKLKEKKIFSDRDAQEILAMEPFPKLA